MSVLRRELLAGLGLASAGTLLWGLGCGTPSPALRRAPQVSGEVRTWLHDAIARLATSYPIVHALAVSRRRTTAALDVLGAGIARERTDGVVLTVGNRDGSWREHAIAELTESSVDAAARALGASRERKPLELGRPPATPDEPPAIDERDLRQRVERLLHTEPRLSSRIVYAAALIDIDDTIVWSVAPGRDLEQRLLRIRQTATRAASNGTRPVVRDIERAYAGWLDDQALTTRDLTATSEAALELMTPGTFDDGERTVVLDPSVVAALFDTVVDQLLTTTAARRPDVVQRAALGAVLASPRLTLLDDPTTPHAYGGFAFDDEGEPAAPITLLDAGRIAARLADRATGGAGRGRRAGHLGPLAPSPSHLVVVPGTTTPADLYSDGFALEGGLGATYDPATGRVRIACARARELKAGNTTGRTYPGVELVGSLTALLSSIDAIASDPASFAPRQPAAALTHRSISAPALRARGFVRARRARA